MHFAVGDIVQRTDIKGRKRFVIVRIATASLQFMHAINSPHAHDVNAPHNIFAAGTCP